MAGEKSLNFVHIIKAIWDVKWYIFYANHCCTSSFDNKGKKYWMSLVCLKIIVNEDDHHTWGFAAQFRTKVRFGILVFYFRRMLNIKYRISGIFRVGKFWRKWRLEGVLNFQWVLFSLFQGISRKTYSRVYISLCLSLAISGRSRTRRKLYPRENFPIYGIRSLR